MATATDSVNDATGSGRYALKENSQFLIADGRGDITTSSDGLFRDDMRVLSRFKMDIGARGSVAAAVGRQSRQRALSRSPDQSAAAGIGWPLDARGRDSHRAKPVPVGLQPVGAHRADELRKQPRSRAVALPVRRRLRRYIRGPRARPQTARPSGRPGNRRRLSALSLRRPGRKTAFLRHRLLHSAGSTRRRHRGIQSEPRRTRATGAVPDDFAGARRRARTAVVPRRGRTSESRDAPKASAWRILREQRRAVPAMARQGARRPRAVDRPVADRPLPLRRHSVVFHAVRPRRADHRAADAVVRSGARARRAPVPGRESGPRIFEFPGCRAREDPPRDAQERDGAARRSSVPVLLRRGGQHAALRVARGGVREAHGRHGIRRFAAPRARRGVGLDRRRRRLEQGRARRLSARAGDGIVQPGLEGQLRFDLP